MDEAHKQYMRSPELFSYTQTLDSYVDQIEASVGEKDKEILKWYNDAQQLQSQLTEAGKECERLRGLIEMVVHTPIRMTWKDFAIQNNLL